MSCNVSNFLKSFCKKVNSLIANFWWGGCPDNRKVHWVSWDKLTQPKDRGGISFKDMVSFNLALLAKQTWRMMENPSTLSYRVMKGIYFSSGFLYNAKRGHKPSWIWGSLLEGRKEGDYGRVDLGSGKWKHH